MSFSEQLKEEGRMRRKTYNVLIAAVVINLLLVVGVMKYNIVSWTIPADYIPGNETQDIHAKLQTTAAANYDFNMHVSYRLKVLQTENITLARSSGCARVMANPVSFWRSRFSTSSNFTADVDFARMNSASRCATIPIAEFIKTPPLPTLYSFETPYLEDPPVKDILKVSNESTSRVTRANSSSTFFIGDTVALLITVRDGEGNPKSKGGDEIRAWFTDVSSSNSTLPAKITDYGNGTYLATSVLAFVGTFRAYVALAYSREYIQTYVLNQLMMKATVIHVGVFSNSLANETSVCLHVPVIPGANQTEICNVTEINGSPWFCGRPVKPWLQCTDFFYTRRFEKFFTMPMNTVEKLLMNRKNKISIIPGGSNITFTVSARADNKNLTRLVSSKKCSSIPPRLTWEQPEPTGYLYKGLWHTYLCRRPEKASDKCLRNIHIIVMGDSNGRELYQGIASKSSCKEQIIRTYTAWHRPLKCINKLLNFTVEWLPHSNPFRTTQHRWDAIRLLKASNKVIDTIPNTGRYLIHLNHYLHPSTSHVSAYVNMMTAIKASLVRLLNRNPNVTVVLQGPHVAWRLGQQSSYLLGDTQRKFFTTIQYEVFEDLRDHIYYLQTSDITIASISNEYHPVNNWQISNQLLGFICEN